MNIECLDHLVLTVAGIEETIHFYESVLGMTVETFGDNRTALRFGNQKINLHQKGAVIEPKALFPTPGSADLCFITAEPIDQVTSHLAECGVPVIDGPVERTGATSRLVSVYFRDPDGNLIEVSNRV